MRLICHGHLVTGELRLAGTATDVVTCHGGNNCACEAMTFDACDELARLVANCPR